MSQLVGLVEHESSKGTEHAKDYTCVLLVGNSDDRLTQRTWSEFTAELEQAIIRCSSNLYQQAYTAPTSRFQSATYTFAISANSRLHAIQKLRDRFDRLRAAYGQNKIAFVVGTTEFLQSEAD